MDNNVLQVIETALMSEKPHIELQKLMDDGFFSEHIPELCRLDGMSQNTIYHKHDVWGHIKEVVKQAPEKLEVRWAALLHDVAKGRSDIRITKNGQPSDPGHDKVGSEMAHDILMRLSVSKRMQHIVPWLILNHMLPINLTEESLNKWIRKRRDYFQDVKQIAAAIDCLMELRIADIRGGKNMIGERLADVNKMYDVFKKVLVK